MLAKKIVTAIVLVSLVLVATAATRRLTSVEGISPDNTSSSDASNASRVDTSSCGKDTIEPTFAYDELQSRVVYPEDARQAGIRGRVIVRVLVDDSGTPIAHSILESAHALLTEAAIEALMNTRFVPAQRDGKSVTCWVYVPVTFKLD